MERAEEATKKRNTARKKKKKEEAEKVPRRSWGRKRKEAKAPAAGDADLEDFSSRRS